MANSNRSKFKALVHYICARSQDDPKRLGATKLNKILWYAETGHFLKSGQPLTGMRYVKRQHGPVPAAITFVLDELVGEGKLIIREPLHDYDAREFITLQEPEIDSMFSASDIRDIDRIIDVVCEAYSAKSISRKSHNEAWHMAEIGEDLPLFTVLARAGEMGPEDLKWADEQIAQIG